MPVTASLQAAIRNNDFPAIHKLCLDIQVVNAKVLAPYGYYLLSRRELMTPAYTFAIEARASISMVLALMRSGVDASDRGIGLIMAYASKRDNLVQALIKAGVTLNEESRRSAAYNSLSDEDKGYLEALLILEEIKQDLLSIFRSNRLTNHVRDCIYRSTDAFADFINKIVDQEVENPFNPQQWNKLCKEIDELTVEESSHLNKKLHVQKLAMYKHPSLSHATAEELSPTQKKQISNTAHEVVHHLLNSKPTKDELTTLTNFFALSLHDKSNPALKLRKASLDILAKYISAYDFHIDNPESLADPGVLSDKNYEKAKDYFRLNCLEKIQQKELAPVEREPQQTTTVTQFPDVDQSSLILLSSLRRRISFFKSGEMSSRNCVEMVDMMKLIDQLEQSKNGPLIELLTQEVETYFRDLRVGKDNQSMVSHFVRADAHSALKALAQRYPEAEANSRLRAKIPYTKTALIGIYYTSYKELGYENYEHCVVAPVIYAAMYGYASTLSELVNFKNLQLNAIDESYGRSALIWSIFQSVPASAVMHGFMHSHADCANVLLRQPNIDVNIRDKAFGKTALMYAIEKDLFGLIESILSNPTLDATLQDDAGQTALNYAVMKDNVQLVKRILLLQKDRLNREEATRLLFYTLSVGTSNSTSVLLACPYIDVNCHSKDNSEKTPLMFAVESERQDIINQILGDPKFDPTAKDAFGNTALTYAANKNNTQLLERLITLQGNGINIQECQKLMLAAIDKNKFIIFYRLLMILKQKSTLNFVITYSPLIRAVLLDRADFVRILLNDPGCDLNLTDSQGRTAFLMAAEAGLLSQMKVLSTDPRGRCQTHARNNAGQNALMIAAQNNHVDCVEYLLSQSQEEADINAALLLAASKGHLNCMNLLLAHPKCDINATGAAGKTASMPAIEGGYLSLVVTGAAGKTALMLAIEGGYLSLVQRLAGDPECRVNVADAFNETAFNHAIRRCDPEIVKCLLGVPGIDVYNINRSGESNYQCARKRMEYDTHARPCIRLLFKFAPVKIYASDEECLQDIFFGDKEMIIATASRLTREQAHDNPRAYAASVLLQVQNLIQLNSILTLDSDLHCMLLDASLASPRLVASYVDNIITHKVQNPFNVKQWERFVRVLADVYNKSPDLQKTLDTYKLQKTLDTYKLHEYHHPEELKSRKLGDEILAFKKSIALSSSTTTHLMNILTTGESERLSRDVKYQIEEFVKSEFISIENEGFTFEQLRTLEVFLESRPTTKEEYLSWQARKSNAEQLLKQAGNETLSSYLDAPARFTGVTPGQEALALGYLQSQIRKELIASYSKLTVNASTTDDATEESSTLSPTSNGHASTSQTTSSSSTTANHDQSLPNEVKQIDGNGDPQTAPSAPEEELLPEAVKRVVGMRI